MNGIVENAAGPFEVEHFDGVWDRRCCMTQIIRLDREVELATQKLCANAGDSAARSAEIVLFPGVRYERWKEPTEMEGGMPVRGAGPRVVARDWLEI